MGRAARWVVCLLAGVAMAFAVPQGAARADDALRVDERKRAAAAIESAVRSLDIQTEMPKKTERSERLSRGRSGTGEGITLSPELARMLLWIAVGVFLLSVLLTLRDNFRLAPPPKQTRPNGSDAGGGHEIRQRMGAARVEADELAASGNYAEAMHVLLLQGLGEMRRRLDTPIAASLTSREILARVPLSPDAGTALSDIITRVEVSYFGDHGVGPDEYARCRESYVVLTGALQGGGAS